MNKTLFIISAIVLAAIARVIPHPWNFTPVLAMILFGTSFAASKKWAWVIPFAAIIVSDIFVNATIQAFFTDGFAYFSTMTALGVYTSYALVAGIGYWVRRRPDFTRTFIAAVASSLVFYVVTNTFMWVGNPFYSQDITGWSLCLTAGIPFIQNEYGTFMGSFFWNQIMGDLFYTGLLFGGYALAIKQRLISQKAA